MIDVGVVMDEFLETSVERLDGWVEGHVSFLSSRLGLRGTDASRTPNAA
jgi:hypothetical protein